MSKKRNLNRFILLSSAIVLAVLATFFLWQHYKYEIVGARMSDMLNSRSDSLYYLSYDYLHFDEVSGNADLKNVRVVPDTARIREIPTEKLASVLLDVRIDSITIKGVKTLKALEGNNLSGDTILISHPQVTMYILKPLNKNTLIEEEAQTVYKNILGKLKSIRVGFVSIDSIQVKAVHFRSGEKGFDFLNGNIALHDVFIDSIHNEDASRVLFSRRADFKVDSFVSYNNNRPELMVEKVSFSGAQRSIVFDKILINRFDDESGDGKVLLNATTLKFTGLNTNAIVKEKDVLIDSIYCRDVQVYEPPGENLPDIDIRNHKPLQTDTVSGFENAYSLKLNYLSLDHVQFYPVKEKNAEWGPVSFQLYGIAADRFSRLKVNPLKYIKEVNLEVEYVKATSEDHQYRFGLRDIRANSLQKNFQVGSVTISPVLGEAAYANHYPFQKDRYEVSMKGISLDGIEIGNIFDFKLIASSLTIQSTSLKIFRDLQKPLEQKSKVGNYPSQMLEKLELPVMVNEADLPSVFVEYREKQLNSGETGTISFNNTSLLISNITNDRASIARNNLLGVHFKSMVLGKIPLAGDFKFFLGSHSGKFYAKGEVGGFPATTLNRVSVPMAMVRLRSGMIHGMDFDFIGDDHKASGSMTMKYDNLKVEVLRKNDESGVLHRRGLLSLLANIVVVDSNPKNGQLRVMHPERARDVNKSFFNLVWKTIFDGMKETISTLPDEHSEKKP